MGSDDTPAIVDNTLPLGKWYKPEPAAAPSLTMFPSGPIDFDNVGDEADAAVVANMVVVLLYLSPNFEFLGRFSAVSINCGEVDCSVFVRCLMKAVARASSF